MISPAARNCTEERSPIRRKRAGRNRGIICVIGIRPLQSGVP